MKKSISILFLCFYSFVNAQDLNNWQVGLNLSPFVFSRLNTENYSKDKQNFPNGLGFGITLEKNWNENWGIKTGFEYTKQNVKYFVKYDADFDTKITSNFEYYKAPFTLQFNHSIRDNLYLTFNQGIQFSFLKYLEIKTDQRYFVTIFTSDYYQVIDDINPSQNQFVYQKQNAYNENLFGIIGSIGLKGFLSTKISYSTNLRYEYDFSDTDKTLFFKGTSTKPIQNLRLGLELGLQYHFSINSERFDKRPHKL